MRMKCRVDEGVSRLRRMWMKALSRYKLLDQEGGEGGPLDLEGLENDS